MAEQRFIGEPVTVAFNTPPFLEKKPGRPDRFTWDGQTFEIEALVSEWHDYRRRGRMAQNMQPQHAARAARTGSWGVGRDYYRVRCAGGRCFDIYYDRAPQGANRRKGRWFLDREIFDQD